MRCFMGVEGLWTIQFRSSLKDFGAGVVVLTNNKIFGGDSGFWYSGHYSIGNGHVTSKLLVARFTPGYISVFGDIDQFQLEFDADFTENSFAGKASIPGHPDLTMEIRGTKKMDL